MDSCDGTVHVMVLTWVFPILEVGSVPWSLGPCHEAGEVCVVILGPVRMCWFLCL